MSEYTGPGNSRLAVFVMAEKARVFRLFRDCDREPGTGPPACISTLYAIAYNVRVSNPPHQYNVRLQADYNVRIGRSWAIAKTAAGNPHLNHGWYGHIWFSMI